MELSLHAAFNTLIEHCLAFIHRAQLQSVEILELAIAASAVFRHDRAIILFVVVKFFLPVLLLSEQLRCEHFFANQPRHVLVGITEAAVHHLVLRLQLEHHAAVGTEVGTGLEGNHMRCHINI